MLKEIALSYFDAFSRLDIKGIPTFFSDNVSLRDWNLNVKGLEAVIQEYRLMFDVSKGIQVKVINLFEDSRTVIAEIEISQNASAAIKVVDILSFDDRNKIFSIRAFKG